MTTTSEHLGRLLRSLNETDLAQTSDFLIGTPILPGDRVVAILTTFDPDDVEDDGLLGYTNYAAPYSLPIRGVFNGDGSINADTRQPSVDLLSSTPFHLTEYENVFDRYGFVFMKESSFDSITGKLWKSKTKQYDGIDIEGIIESFILHYTILVDSVHDDHDTDRSRTVYLKNEDMQNTPEWDVFGVSSMFDEYGGFHSRFLSENVVFFLQKSTYDIGSKIVRGLIELHFFIQVCKATSKSIHPSPLKPTRDDYRIELDNEIYRILLETFRSEL